MNKLPAHAERLWLQLQSNLLDFHKTLLEIFETEAWKPGYETFTEAWADRMSNISFAPELLPLIMYQMFSEGQTAEEVAGQVKNIGVDTAERVKQQHDMGVPVEIASTIVRTHRRQLPTRVWLRIEVDAETLACWKRTVKRHQLTLDEVALPAIAEAIKRLDSGAE